MRDAVKFDPRRGSLGRSLYGIARNHVLRSLGPAGGSKLPGGGRTGAPDADPLGRPDPPGDH